MTAAAAARQAGLGWAGLAALGWAGAHNGVLVPGARWATVAGQQQCKQQLGENGSACKHRYFLCGDTFF